MAALKKSLIDERLQSTTLSAREKKVRDDFVTEYLKDANPTKAAIRIGYGASFAHEMAVRFLQEPYTLQQISLREVQTAGITEEQMKVEVKARLYRVMKDDRVPYPSVVAAASKLASLLGMDVVKQSDAQAAPAILMTRVVTPDAS